MPRGNLWDEKDWYTFAKKVYELRKLPQHLDRKYLGAIYLEAQKVLPMDKQRSKQYFSASGRNIKSVLEDYFRQFNHVEAIVIRAETKPIDEPKKDGLVDYEKLSQMVIARLRPEIVEHVELMVKVELDSRLKGLDQTAQALPHWALKPGAKTDAIKIRIALFGVEEKNINTNRFNYLKHCLEIKIWNGGNHTQAKHTADLSELCIIAANSNVLTKIVIDEVKKSKTKTIFTSGGLSAIDAALQTFCHSKGFKFTAPEHPSHQH